MTIVALTHGYVPAHSLGGEVALHRALCALTGPRAVLTTTPEPYVIDGIHVEQIDTPNVLDIHADPRPIAAQLEALGARVVIGQNELSLPAVKAARILGIPSVVNVHTPPRYGRGVRDAVRTSDHVVFNTHTSAREWGKLGSLVVHPIVPPLPPVTQPTGDAYTLLSNLANKGVTVVLEIAKRLPDQRFIIVRSPAETTHGIPDFDARAAQLPNVEVHPRVAPEQVAERYLSQTRIILVPSRMETYSLAPIEAAGYGIPSVCIMNDHVNEGIGHAAYGVPGLDVEATLTGIRTIEAEYTYRSKVARARAEHIHERQQAELAAWSGFIDTIR